MCRSPRLRNSLFAALTVALAALGATAQVPVGSYSPGPSSTRETVALNAPHPRAPSAADLSRSTAYSPTQIYRIGVGDVLYINIVNSSNGKGFYTVRNDGTIDYP